MFRLKIGFSSFVAWFAVTGSFRATLRLSRNDLHGAMLTSFSCKCSDFTEQYFRKHLPHNV